MTRDDDYDALRAAHRKLRVNTPLPNVATPPVLSATAEELRFLKRIIETFHPDGQGNFTREFRADFNNDRDSTARSYKKIIALAGGEEKVTLTKDGKDHVLSLSEDVYMRLCAKVGYECGTKLSAQGLAGWAECKRQHAAGKSL